jgi:hypothetical protein
MSPLPYSPLLDVTPVCPSPFQNTYSSPYYASWSSWWHPQQAVGIATEHVQGAGTLTKDWNILYHLGGNGPWVEKVVDIVDGGIAPPEGCEVVQIHMVCYSHDYSAILESSALEQESF